MAERRWASYHVSRRAARRRAEECNAARFPWAAGSHVFVVEKAPRGTRRWRVVMEPVA